MKKNDRDKVAEYTAVYKAKKEKKPLGAQAIIVLLAVTALVLVASVVVMSLYFTGVFDAASVRRDGGKKTDEKKTYDGFLQYEVPSTLPLGSYAHFTYEANGKEYVFSAYLLSSYAPNTVNNFLTYAKAGFYNGTAVKEGKVTQKDGIRMGVFTCGGYVRNASGKLTYKISSAHSGAIKGEFAANGYEANRISHTAGVIGMWHSDDSYDDATTDFYVLPYDDESMNGYYAAFAKITTATGLTAARQVASFASDGVAVTLKSVTITVKQ